MTLFPEWSLDKALTHYNIANWGAGYFTINSRGHLACTPYGKNGPSIDIMDVVEDIREKKLGFPCTIRFQDVLRSRVVALNESFRRAIADHNYRGAYFGVYPIKVNQMREIVEEILDAGAPYHMGLEAGSKAELLTVLGLNDDLDALTICNGYKDDQYLKLALLGRKLGRKVIVVIEKLSELPAYLNLAQDMGVAEPMIGLRAKLTTRGAGKWEHSGGDFAKFGLTTPEIIKVCTMLRERKMEGALKLFHFHVGSQLTDIRTVKNAVREGARIYAKLKKMGFPLDYFDVGGGLGVDYDGSRTTFESSMNYTMEEYCSDVIYQLQQICEAENVPPPNVVSESGRALVAHHSCVIMNVFGHIEIGEGEQKSLEPPPKDEHEVVREMRETLQALSPKNLLESFHDAVAKKDEALQRFSLGFMSLEDRAKVENLFWEVLRSILRLQERMTQVPEDLQRLQDALADQYLANFSLFQSAPDHWAVKQLFPIVPVHRFDERPTRETTIVDITCDSDGKIDKFIDLKDVRETLSLHSLRPGEPYFLGVFLVGAYQDIMGDMHNLFGRVNEVHVFCDDEDPEDYYIEEIIPGDPIIELVTRLQYDPHAMMKKIKNALEQKVKEGAMKPKESVMLTDFYEEVMRGYTYLTHARSLD
ncbi:MAG: biosynthetic arginine decarboxylase [Deltaproteobacteria bacterium]|nr:biosynthetic arginine decarboxylase [Deltaproteobacteria bacterium]